MKGRIFNIQKYAIHDGPGIRTTIFFKGCPLNCKWCHNPESISQNKELMYYKDLCLNCRLCNGFTNSSVCPSEALVEIGQDITSEDLMDEVMKDEIFYKSSGGGVTFSGGEPLFQADFLLELLIRSKRHKLTTVVDTCGFAKTEDFLRILPYVDLFHFDIKHLNEAAHIEGTGVSLSLILENLKVISLQNQVILRMPLIKNYNDEEDTIKKIIELAQDHKIKKIHFLPYHHYGSEKYVQLMENRKQYFFEALDNEKLDWIIKLCDSMSIQGQIGG